MDLTERLLSGKKEVAVTFMLDRPRANFEVTVHGINLAPKL